ncbi:MAG: aldo/keto reductase [Pelomonas sp.]|nr:aldo/keto reductase [Roseateles sp.]
MKQRRIGPFEVSAIGFGCMNLSHAYGTTTPKAQALEVLGAALDGGITLFDTAALYGFGDNEELLGDALAGQRQRIVLTSKCGMYGVDGRRVIDGRPETIRAGCEASLRRLKTDAVDLLYLHRLDPKVPVEDSVGAMADLVRAGKVRALGLSEVSAATLRRAHAVHPIAALQSEYSLWTRNPEIAVLDACDELGVGFVAFSPLGRGFLAGAIEDVRSLHQNDIRRCMPRFQPDTYAENLKLYKGFEEIAHAQRCTPAALALAWLLHAHDGLVPIPGTTRVEHLAQWLPAVDLALDAATRLALERLINPQTVSGARYAPATQLEIDTEEFPVPVECRFERCAYWV